MLPGGVFSSVPATGHSGPEPFTVASGKTKSIQRQSLSDEDRKAAKSSNPLATTSKSCRPRWTEAKL